MDFGTSSQYPALKVDFDGNGEATAYEFGVQERDPPPFTVPTQIIGLSAVASNMQVTLSWTVPDNGGDLITAYEIKQATSSVGLDAAAPTIVDVVDIPNGAVSGVSVTYIVGSLTNGTTYYFQVAAKNSVGLGTDSNEAFATPLVPLVPMISFSDLSGSAVDASSGSSAPLDVSLAVSDGGFVNATNITITVAATTGEIADGDYTLAVKSGSLATLTSANPYTLSVPANETSITLEFTSEDDDTEGEAVTLTLSGAATDIGAQHVHTIIITDEDAALSVLPTSLMFVSEGETQALSIMSNTSWMASSDAGWLTLSTFFGFRERKALMS